MTTRDFIFNNKGISDFGCMAIEVDEESSLGISRDIIGTELSQVRNSIDIYGTKYQDTLPLKFFIIKDRCKSTGQIDEYFQPQELSPILAWLTSPKTTRKLTLVNDLSTKEYFGVFTEIQPYEAGSKLYGIIATFKCDSPYGYAVRNTSVACTTTKQVTINNSTDELEEYTYPVITISPAQIGTYSIKNTTEKMTMTITIKKAYKELVIDCDNHKITGDGKPLTFADIGWDKMEMLDWNGVGTGTCKLYWTRFLPGNNVLEFSGNATFKVQYRNPVKSGGY